MSHLYSNGNKIILDLCGGTGAWSQPYKDDGYDVRLVTSPVADVRFVEYHKSLKVYGILAAPPCTVFASSGARWKRTIPEMIEGLSVVDACLRLIMIYQPEFWVLENPIGKLVRYLGKPKMYFQPFEYGDPYTKKTCLWGNFNHPITNPVEPIYKYAKNGKRFSPMHFNTGGKSEKTKRLRSITPPGFAKAFFDANK